MYSVDFQYIRQLREMIEDLEKRVAALESDRIKLALALAIAQGELP